MDKIIVNIPDYGLYPLSPDVQGASLQPETATVDDLLSTAVFSADYALNALTPECHAPVSGPEIAPFDASIVVLGNGLNDDGSVHPNLANRLES